jgi:hypothetical protein
LSHDWIADINFFDLLDAEDARVAAAVKAGGCPDCGGRLDRADYPRKPRGGELGAAGEMFDRRRSLCCAREGCRHRRTPPSLVFLGRRVYVAIAIVLAAWRTAPVTATPPRRTVGRWRSWFLALRESAWWTEQRGRLWPPIEPAEILPAAIVERLQPDRSIARALFGALGILASAPGLL